MNHYYHIDFSHYLKLSPTKKIELYADGLPIIIVNTPENYIDIKDPEIPYGQFLFEWKELEENKVDYEDEYLAEKEFMEYEKLCELSKNEDEEYLDGFELEEVIKDRIIDKEFDMDQGLFDLIMDFEKVYSQVFTGLSLWDVMGVDDISSLYDYFEKLLELKHEMEFFDPDDIGSYYICDDRLYLYSF